MTVLGRHIETVQPSAAPASRPGERREGCQGRGRGEEAKSFKQSVTVTSEACLTSGGCTSEILWHPWKEIDGYFNYEKKTAKTDWKLENWGRWLINKGWGPLLSLIVPLDPALVSRHQTTGNSSPETNIPADLRSVPHSINFQIFCQGALWPRIVLVDVSIFTRPGTKFLANIRVITLPWLLPWPLPWRRWCPILGSAVRTRLKSPPGNFSPSLSILYFPGLRNFTAERETTAIIWLLAFLCGRYLILCKVGSLGPRTPSYCYFKPWPQARRLSSPHLRQSDR